MPDENVEGLQALLASMSDLPLVLQKNLIVRSLRKAAKPIADRMQATAPDDPETPGSRVREAISVTVTDQTATGAIAKVGPTRRGFPAIFAELGTIHQPARAFIGPAFDHTIEDAYKQLGEELGDGIEREFAKRR